MTLFDRIRDTSTTTATLSPTTTFTVSGSAPSGFQTFSARFVSSPADSNIPVVIAHQTANEWQVCWCSYTASNTLRVDTIIASSNADSGVAFSAGTKDVFVANSSKAVAALRENNTFTGTNTFPNTGLKILESGGSPTQTLTIAPGSALTADRTLTITTGDADRTLDISAGNVTISTAGAALIDDADASAQRTTLGLAIGTNVQAYDADLAALAGLSTNGMIARTGAGTAAVRTLTAGSNISITNGDGVSGNPTIAATGLQASDATLTALAAYNTNGLLTQTTADTFTGRSIAAGTGITVTNGDGVAGNPTVSLTSNTISGVALGNNLNTLTLGTGLGGTSYNGSGAVTASVTYGTTASTACVGNDARLSDARTPTSHTHGNISNAGAIGSTANLPVITTTSGVLTTGTFGTTANTFAQGNDSRLSDTRTPTDGTVSTAKIQDDAVTYAKIQNVSATDRILGRSSAGAGDVEEITCTAAGRALLDDATTLAQQGTLGFFDTVAAVNAATIDSSVNHIRTAGYYAAGDGGGALYKKVSGTPASPSDKRYITSSGPVYWEFAEPEVNIKQFGAKGDAPTTDDTTAVQDAINSDLPVIIPAGSFKITTKLTKSTGDLIIKGHGNDKSILSFTAGTGGIEYTGATIYNSLELRDFQLRADGTISGPAIYCNFTPTIGLVNIGCAAENILIIGNSGTWANGIRLNNCRNAIFTECNVNGTYGTTGYCWKLEGNSLDVKIDKCKGGGSTQFIYSSGTAEGLMVHNTLCINSDKGIYTDYASAEPGLYVSNCHFNTLTHALDLTNVTQSVIEGCLFYIYSTGTYTGVAIANANSRDIRIANNIFHGTGVAGTKTGISLSAGTRIDIASNTFLDFGTAISLGASSSDVFVCLNRFDGVTTEVADSRTSATSAGLSTSTTSGYPLSLRNSSQAVSDQKLVGLNYQGYDTVGTLKDIARVQAICETGNSNWTASHLTFSTRVSDALNERMRIDKDGNVGIGTISFGTSAAGVLAIANGTAPSTSPTGVGQLYVTSGELKYKSAGGTVSDLSPLPVFATGTYTPTITTVHNLNTATAYVAQYVRVGDMVTVSGKFDADPVAQPDYFHFRMSLPIASAFTAQEDCGGSFGSALDTSGGRIIADAANDEAEFTVQTTRTTDTAYAFVFMYRIK